MGRPQAPPCNSGASTGGPYALKRKKRGCWLCVKNKKQGGWPARSQSSRQAPLGCATGAAEGRRERERERGVCHLCLLGGTHQAWHDGHKVTVLSSTTGRLAPAGPWGAVESGQVGEGRRRRRGAPPGSHLVDQLQHDVARAVAVARHGDAAVLVDALEDRGAHHVLVAVAAHAALLGGYLGTGLGAAQACDGRRGQQRDLGSGEKLCGPKPPRARRVGARLAPSCSSYWVKVTCRRRRVQGGSPRWRQRDMHANGRAPCGKCALPASAPPHAHSASPRPARAPHEETTAPPVPMTRHLPANVAPSRRH